MPADAAPAPAPRVPYVLGGPLRRPGRAAAWSAAVLAAIVALPLRGLYRATGSSMEEGFMLVFPRRMLAGDIPNVDFLHLYGPGSLHWLMGWYQVFGDTLGAQRTFGLLQHLGVISAVYALGRPWGHRLAVIAATVVTLLVLTPIGLSALAWEGAVALGAWSVVFAVRALHLPDDRRERLLAVAAAGALAGAALSFRPDLVVALGLAHLAVIWRLRLWRCGTDAVAACGGVVVGLVPMWIHLAVAGWSASWRGMVTQPVRELRPGRELPRPPSFDRVDGALQAVAEGPLDAPWWRLPALAAHHQLWLWFWMVLLVTIGVPLATWLLIRRRGTTPARTALLIGALFGLGLIGQALQRPDSTHLAWGSCISFGLLAPLGRELLAARRAGRTGRAWRADAQIAVGMIVALAVICPYYTYRSYLFAARVSIGDKPGGFEVSRGDRRFYFGNAALQRASQAAIDRLAADSRPGERLLVGPADLSRTIYSDAVFYYLFPELEPATFYIEMDPGLADRPGSGLAEDVASADWVLLTNFWTGWYEPNASVQFGDDTPNQVVAERFCLVGNYEDALVLLYRACADGDGVSPAGLGIGAQRRADLEAEIAERARG